MNYLNILKKAEKKEIKARDYYKFLAERSIDKNSTETLIFLSGEEEKHRKKIRQFIDSTAGERKKISVRESPDVERIWKKHMDALDKIRDDIFLHTDEPTIVQKAVDIEKNSLEMYKKAQASTEEKNLKKLFGLLSKAEERHLELVMKLLKKVVWLYEEFPETRPNL